MLLRTRLSSVIGAFALAQGSGTVASSGLSSGLSSVVQDAPTTSSTAINTDEDLVMAFFNLADIPAHVAQHFYLLVKQF